MAKLQKLLVEEGTTFSNAMVHTPICCPSRSSYLSGRYLHNSLTFQNKATDGCANISWAAGPEKDTFAAPTHSAGYHTSYSGKHPNAYGVIEVVLYYLVVHVSTALGNERKAGSFPGPLLPITAHTTPHTA